jgi:hypothetical protein
MARHHDNGHEMVGAVFVGADMASEGNAFNRRHRHVGQDQVELTIVQHSKSGVAVGGFTDRANADRGQKFTQQYAHMPIVLDNEDPEIVEYRCSWFHRRPSFVSRDWDAAASLCK